MPQVELTCKICKICARILHKSCMQNMQDLQIALQGRARFLQKSCSVHGKCPFSCTYLANSCRNLAIHFCKILQAIFRHARNLALLISCKKRARFVQDFNSRENDILARLWTLFLQDYGHFSCKICLQD